MLNSSRYRVLGFAALLMVTTASASHVQAQQQSQGFAVERFYPSAAGGGWFVMDALDMQSDLGGAMALTLGYARNPLRIADGAQNLAVVSNAAFAGFGFAITHTRFRLSLDMDMPLVITGDSGTVGGYSFAAPSVNPGANPDTLSDYRIGFDARIFGQPSGRFRLGAGAQLVIPNGHRADYDSDGTLRAMGRILFAGDVGRFSYAGHLGVHMRPLDDSSAPGSPHGSELLFGAAAGARLSVGSRWALLLGPEVYGETALRSFFGENSTGIEGLMTGRIEGTGEGPQLRVKLGLGGGIDSNFGAPELRILVALELFTHH
jgi:hypothetical protein